MDTFSTTFRPVAVRRGRPLLSRAGAIAGSAWLVAAGAVATAAPTSAATERAHWLLNESSGTAALDSTSNHNNGRNQNIAMTGAGYTFNGTSSRVIVPSSASLNPGTGDFTFSVTFSTSSSPAKGEDYDLLRKGVASTSGGEYKIEIINTSGASRALCIAKDSRKVVAKVQGTTNLTDGRVHTITCTKTSSGLTLTVDSLAPRRKAIALGTISNTAPLVLGAKAEGGDWYRGFMDEARVV